MSLGVIINIAIGAVIAIAALIGVLAGFTRQFSKPLVGIVGILGSVALVMLLYPLIFNTGILDGFVTKATGWFTADFYSRPIYDVESFQAAISDNYLRIFSGSAERLLVRMQTLLGTEEVTIGAFFGRAIVNVIIEFAMWLIFYLIIKYFLFGVKYLLGKITQVVVFKTIDRILGLAWALLWTYLILVAIVLTAGEIVVAQFAPDFEAKLAEWITSASLLRLAHDTNVIGSFIANIIGVRLVTL